MAGLLWKCITISIILLFGINIGLSIGLSKVYRNKVLIISIFYGAAILILSIIAHFYNNVLFNVFNVYISQILGIIGILTILSGIYTINNWRKNKKGYDSVLQAATLSSSICCFAGFISTAVLLNKVTDSYFLEIGALMALAMVVMVVIFYYFSTFLKNAETPYPVLLGNFMVLNGFYFAVAGLFIPNIDTLSSMQMDPLSINSTSSMIFLVMTGLGVFLLGVYLKTENITSLKDIYQRKASINSNKTKKT